MRDAPLYIGGVAMESATDMIVNSSLCHFFQRAARHHQSFAVVGQAVGIEQKQQCVLIWKLRSLIKPAQPIIVVIAVMLEQRFDRLLTWKGAGCIVFLLFNLDDGASQPLAACAFTSA